jgi:hypothetical protein
MSDDARFEEHGRTGVTSVWAVDAPCSCCSERTRAVSVQVDANCLHDREDEAISELSLTVEEAVALAGHLLAAAKSLGGDGFVCVGTA